MKSMSEGNQQLQESEKDDAEAVVLTDATDICAQLMERYAKSSAPQHRHLLASAVAMRSILHSESLPLTPAAYFAAAISAIDNASASDTLDPTALSALLSFLAIALPLVPPGGISAPNASEAAGVLGGLLGMKNLTVSTVRAAVKCLGILLGFCNLEDWASVELGFDTLLKFSVDRRPKVCNWFVFHVNLFFKLAMSGCSAQLFLKSFGIGGSNHFGQLFNVA